MDAIALPEWTEYRKKNGLDPLGMLNSSVNIYQTLLPGISNVTLRMRYYGLYAWLSGTYATKIRDTNPRTWQRFLRRAEALYALIAQHQGGEFGVAGVDWAGRKLGGNQSKWSFGEDAEPGSPTHYLKQAWGAYGAAYGSQLLEIGVLTSAEGHLIPVPTKEIGDDLAHSFEESIEGAGKRFLSVVERGIATKSELTSLAEMAPSAIGSNTRERNRYEELLFGNTKGPTHENRRKTLLLLIALAKSLQRPPTTVDARWAWYAGSLPDGTPLTLPADLDAHRKRWWVYQANDLSHICYEALLKYLLSLLEQRPDGLPLETVVSEAIAGISDPMEKTPKTWSAFLHQNKPVSNAGSGDKGSDAALAASIMKAARQEVPCTADHALAAIRLLAVLHNRARENPATIEAQLSGLDATHFRSLKTEVAFLERRTEQPFSEVLTTLFEERVFRRHMWIALRKLRYQGDYTFLFELDNGRVRKRDIDGPVYTNPRLGPSTTFLHDIHLISDKGPTARGAKLLVDAA